MSEGLTRFVIATSKIRGNHTLGRGSTDEETLIVAGYRNPHDYWADALSEPMEAGTFSKLLEGWLLDPAYFAEEARGRAVSFEALIKAALRVALNSGEPWIKAPPPRAAAVSPTDGASYFRRFPMAARIGVESEDVPDVLDSAWLHPREAACWLLGMPMRRALVPETLRAFLDGEEQTSPTSASVSLEEIRLFLEETYKDASAPSKATAENSVKKRFAPRQATRLQIARVHKEIWGTLRSGPRF